jgi:hypothetical protein
MRDLVDSHVPKAAVISGGLDHLNTHTPAALYATFPPAEAYRIVRKLAVHDTPKHGRWRNRADIEFAVVATQCLDRRLGTPGDGPPCDHGRGTTTPCGQGQRQLASYHD